MTNACLRVALAAAVVCGASATLVAPAHAGLGDKLKKKIESKVNEKTDKAVDKAADAADPTSSSSSTGTAGGESAKLGKAGDNQKVSAVSTKYDFIPGDKVIWTDDFTLDPLGEFPSRLKPVDGTVEIDEQDGQRWLRAVGENSKVLMKHGLNGPLPERWTLEFDYWGATPFYGSFVIEGKNAADGEVWHLEFSQGGGNTVFFRTGSQMSSVPLGDPEVLSGKHHVAIMARGTGLKIYFDRDRVVNTPETYVEKGPTTEILLWMRDLRSKPMMTNIRFAEGPKPAKDLLESGKLVTYGIRFATGSDVVQPESAPVLRDVSTYMAANPAVKLSITGHTDNVGTPASNLDLSKRRAAAVAKALSTDFGVAADRLTTDGKGDTQKIADNASVEGRAMNRRVEFTKQ
jgi:hypothetical protein